MIALRPALARGFLDFSWLAPYTRDHSPNGDSASKATTTSRKKTKKAQFDENLSIEAYKKIM
jgi:hypothetical protein